MGGVDSGLGQVGVGSMGTLGAYGLSMNNVAQGQTGHGMSPGFDNFNAAGGVQQSSLGAPGFGGTAVGSVDPNGTYSGPGGVMTGSMLAGLQGGLPSAQGYVGTDRGLTPAVAGALAATGQPATGYADGKQGYSPVRDRRNALRYR